jgi:hypothetical protein
MVMRATLVLVALVVAARPAAAELNLAEAVCQVRASRNVVATESRRYAKCLLKCAQHLGTLASGATECPLANACANGGLANPDCRCLDRAIQTAVAHEVDGCADCPECYVNAGGDPNPSCEPDANAKSDTVAMWSESLFFTGSPAIFCDDGASPDGLTVAEGKCQQSVAKTLAGFARKTARCYADCRNSALGGGPPGACDAPILTNPAADAKTRACVQNAQAQAALRIDKQCGISTQNRPECYGETDGQGWVTIEQNFVDQQDPVYFCAD